MHLCNKLLKYAFAYASMQMHNNPKRNYKVSRTILFFEIKTNNLFTGGMG